MFGPDAMHPLCGADPATLADVARRHGGPDAGHRAAWAMIRAAVLARAPLSWLERRLMDRHLPDAADMPAPVFILGHWRSGTTHLYNILCQGGHWGYVPPLATGLPWDLFGIARVFRPLLERALPAHRYIDNIPVNPDSPQEDEIAIANMTPVSFYHAIYFPRSFRATVNAGLFFEGLPQADIDQWAARFVYLMRKLARHQGRPLLIKNPVYTGRVGLLRQLFPDARFIHVHRSPYQVFVSMRNFYAKLLAQFALQDWRHVDVDRAILEVYPRMMEALVHDTADLAGNRLVEVAYHDLDTAPLATLQAIHDQLGLPGFADARPAFAAYLDSVRSFQKNRFTLDRGVAETVEAYWGSWINRWGYDRPALSDAA